MGKIAREFLKQHEVPGLSVAIARHGQFVYEAGFGYADKAARELVTPEHRFRIASISKPITAVASFALVEQGRLKLDDLVFGAKALLGLDYGTELAERVRRLTVRHLLTHTSGGWSNNGDDPMFLNPGFNHHELIAWTLANQPLEHEPGTHYAYSNFGFCVLGRVIERVTGRGYEKFVKDTIAEKCGMRALQIAGNTLAQRAADEVVYYDSKEGAPYDMNVARMDSHGGWLARPRELVKFAMHVDGFQTTPSLLKAESIVTMTTPDPVHPAYGCGWFVNKYHNWWHSGSLPGLNTIMVRTASGLCWAAFINTRNKDTGLALDQLVWKLAGAVPAWQA